MQSFPPHRTLRLISAFWCAAAFLLFSASSAEATAPIGSSTPWLSPGINDSGPTADGALWLPPFGSELTVTRSYDLPNGPYRAGHRGIDLPAAEGDEVPSPAAGIVTFVGTVVDRPVVSLRIDARTVVSFEPLAGDLQAGDAVTRGQPLGVVASGGHCNASCLHLGVRVNDEYVNPMRYFRPRPILVPW